ncbi:hypothetical protein T492DRAFT_838158 [Pavlovales sp. CCMP2436]|nr:hypothetical protein T492DRAFT_838158 [Pavlovales sp. CCMP2436]|mmetsp:Transcript_4897/g.12572  ORF Transcript_4897/g.12572 Transcript_4897/m.12572 type:complete len:327 (-) Transcript_4897:85-1065(-)
MLYAFKDELTYRTAKDILSVRERELRFYTRNILNIGAQAALLAGFAFKTLVDHESAGMLEWIDEFASNDTFVIVTDYAGQLDAVQVAMTVFELAYLLSTISAMGSTLYTLYICLITPILGLGLALKGSEGSVDRAVISLAGVNTSVITSFAYSLTLFQFSVLMKAFLTFHLLAACVCAITVTYYFVSIRRTQRRIIKTFKIDPKDIVTGRFNVSAAKSRWDLARTKFDASTSTQAQSGYGSKMRKLVAQLTQQSSEGSPSSQGTSRRRSDPYAQERRERRRSTTSIDAAPHMPKYVAERLMFRLQGPLPRRTPEATIGPFEPRAVI